MGNGPACLANELAGMKAVSIETVAVEERPFELATTMAILRALADRVKAAIADNRLPILLAGGCFNTLAALSAIGCGSTGLIWFDAHADLNTPETTPTGFIDGMPLAAITGRCWRNLVASIPGFHPMPDKNVVLIGARDLDPDERILLESSHVTWLQSESLRKTGIDGALHKALTALPEQVYLHLDLDVLDRAEARVNEYSSPGGLTLAELLEIIRFIGHNRAIVGAAVTAYDPSVDHDAKALHAGIAAIKELLAAVCIDVS